MFGVASLVSAAILVSKATASLCNIASEGVARLRSTLEMRLSEQSAFRANSIKVSPATRRACRSRTPNVAVGDVGSFSLGEGAVFLRGVTLGSRCRQSLYRSTAYTLLWFASAVTAYASDCTPRSRSRGLVASAALWLMPLMLGTKIIAVGQ